jgi:hypothetical protein
MASGIEESMEMLGLRRYRYLLSLNVQVRIPAFEDANQFPVQHPHSRL